MSALPLVRGCTLPASGRAARAASAAPLLRSVTAVELEPGLTRVRFAADADGALLRRLVQAERACCPHLGFELDGDARTLVISAPPAHEADLTAFARSFEEEST